MPDAGQPTPHCGQAFTVGPYTLSCLAICGPLTAVATGLDARYRGPMASPQSHATPPPVGGKGEVVGGKPLRGRGAGNLRVPVPNVAAWNEHIRTPVRPSALGEKGHEPYRRCMPRAARIAAATHSPRDQWKREKSLRSLAITPAPQNGIVLYFYVYAISEYGVSQLHDKRRRRRDGSASMKSPPAL